VTSTHTERISRGLYELPTKEHALYRFYDRTDALLYVGITMDLPKRFRQHRKAKPWWLAVTRVEVEHFDTRGEALGAEKSAIKDECPLYNDQHNEFVEVDLPSITPKSAEPCVPINKIFGWLPDCDPAEYHDRARAEYEVETDDDIATTAVQVAISDLTGDRFQLSYSAERLIRTWPDAIALREKVNVAAKEFDYHHTEAQLLADTLDAVAERRERDWLYGLSDDERDEWLACAATLHGRDVVDAQDDPSPFIIRAAFTYYADYRDYHWTPEKMCMGMGIRGARCPNLVAHRLYFGDCLRTECREAAECVGHQDLCTRHLGKVLDGRIRRHDGTRFVVDRYEDAVLPEDRSSF
jgi:predicted GIY-YIG superfamily endonuclease